MKLIITSLFTLMALSMIAQTRFIAHRGASYLAPENTVASAKLAWELGADAVEVDVHLAKDNRVMVIHDSDTKRTCSGKKNLKIEDNPSMLLRDLDAGSWKGEEFKGEKIPFLSEIIETVPADKTLVVEIKCGEEVLRPISLLLEKSGKADQITFICFDWKVILEAKNQFPENKCFWLSSTKTGLAKKMKEAEENRLDGVNLRYSVIDEEVMKLAKEHNMDVLTWTVDDPKEAKRLAELGVSGITTNRPKWLKEEMTKL